MLFVATRQLRPDGEQVVEVSLARNANDHRIKEASYSGEGVPIDNILKCVNIAIKIARSWQLNSKHAIKIAIASLNDEKNIPEGFDNLKFCSDKCALDFFIEHPDDNVDFDEEQ